MRKLKKSISILLVLVMVLNINTVTSGLINWGQSVYISSYGQVVDSITYNGKTVNAIYAPRGQVSNYDSNSTFCCAAFVTRFYSQIYGITVNNLNPGNTPNDATGGGYFYKVSTPQVGDIAGSSEHWAIVKAVSGNNVTLIEQNCWDKTYTSAKVGRVITMPESSYWYWRYSKATNSESLTRYDVEQLSAQTGRTLSDGDYHIVSALDENFGIDVYGGSTENGTNISLYQNTTDPDQLFTLTYLGNGYYKIIGKKSGKSIDVKDVNQNVGANVQLCEDNGSVAQQWIIRDAGDGYYYNIVSRCNGLCVDVDGGIAANHKNIQMYTPNGTSAQKWKFISVDNEKGKSIDDGKYHIVSALDETKGLDVYSASMDDGANVSVYTNVGDPEQVFEIKYLNNGYYSFIYAKSGKYLDIQDGKYVNKSNVQVYQENGTFAQQWIIRKVEGSEYYEIIAKQVGKALDVAGGIANDLTNVQLYARNGTQAQQWKFVPTLNEEETTSNVDASIQEPTEQPSESLTGEQIEWLTTVAPETTTVTNATTNKPVIKPTERTTEKSTTKSITTQVERPSKVSLSHAKNVRKKSVKLTWKKIKGVNGYEIVYGLNKKYTKGKKIARVSASSKSKTIKKLKKGKTYYFKIRAYKVVGKSKLYGTWSTVKKVKVRK